eukprot:TRINITY_DN5126_c0_g1_i2.p1 TRINITY_DN5126_c0_g1~~TRINITY_DN5126_c0_g1_i2.p1  ORF type:complete len:466 (+),score=89.30 TRINITY_DN5126_c0_g1_i2:213-1610(+)
MASLRRAPVWGDSHQHLQARAPKVGPAAHGGAGLAHLLGLTVLRPGHHRLLSVPLITVVLRTTSLVPHRGADNVGSVLLREGKEVRCDWPTAHRRLLGPGSIVCIHGDAHLRARSMLRGSVDAHQVFGVYSHRIAEIVKRHVSKWSGRVDALSVSQDVTFEVVLNLLFNLDISATQFGKAREMFSEWARGLGCAVTIDLPIFQFGRSMRARRWLLNLIHSKIVERRQSSETPSDMLQIMLESKDDEGATLSDDVIADQLLVFLFAGQDTSSYTLANLLEYVCRNPELKERLVAEQKGIVAEYGSGNDSLSGRVLKEEMPLAWATVNEAMRIRPVVPAIYRRAVQTFNLGGYQIPRGTKLVISIAGTHLTTKAVPDKDVFSPDRFMGERNDKEGTGADGGNAFIPFGGGRRKCIGYVLAYADMVCVLATLVRTYDFDFADGKAPTEWVTRPLPHPKDFRLDLVERS